MRTIHIMFWGLVHACTVHEGGAHRGRHCVACAPSLCSAPCTRAHARRARSSRTLHACEPRQRRTCSHIATRACTSTCRDECLCHWPLADCRSARCMRIWRAHELQMLSACASRGRFARTKKWLRETTRARSATTTSVQLVMRGATWTRPRGTSRGPYLWNLGMPMLISI